jgi:PleD family two-component response regulator
MRGAQGWLARRRGRLVPTAQFAVGANEYITKPVHWPVLRQWIYKR